MILKTSEHKCCVDCEFLLGNRSQYEKWESWECHHERNIKSQHIHSVSGRSETSLHEIRIHMVREGKCNGDWWKEYKKPDYKVMGFSESLSSELFQPQDLESIAAKAAARLQEMKDKKAGRLTTKDLSNL